MIEFYFNESHKTSLNFFIEFLKNSPQQSTQLINKLLQVTVNSI